MKKSTAIGIAAVSVAGALAVGLGAVSSWFTNWDTKTWFGRGDTQTVQPEKPDISDNDKTVSSDGAIISVGESNGIRLQSAKLPRAAYAANGVSTLSDTAYTLTATVSPADSTNKAVDWSVSWVDGDSVWATGKTVIDYVTVTPSENGSSTAVVECKKDFGSQIQIKCTSRDNPELSAVCTVDYTQKIISGSVSGCASVGGPYFTFSENSVVNMFSGGLVLSNPQTTANDAVTYASSKINTTTYTIPDDYTWTLEFKFSNAVYEYLRDNGYGAINAMRPVSFNIYENGKYFVGSYTHPDSFSGCIRENELKQLCGGSEIYKTLDFYNMVGMDFVKKTDGLFEVVSTITGTHSTLTTTYKVTLSQSQFMIHSNDVTLDNDNIIF